MSESFVEDTGAKELKRWWDSFGKAIIVGLVIAILAVTGFRFWRQHLENERIAASQLYDKYQQALMKHEKEGAEAAYQKLRSSYSKTPYATAVTLLSASQYVGENAYDKARQELTWVLEKGSAYAKPLARLRLAQLDASTQHFDDALGLLNDPNAGPYKSAYEELAGDILIQKGDVNAALQHYQSSLELYKAEGFDNILLQYKLQTYGPTSPVSGVK
jgi:predicted negative regulator of RcsB-dependent stress response